MTVPEGNSQPAQQQENIPTQMNEDDPEMRQVIQNSLDTEPLSVDQRGRKEEIPVGLKNVGNSCYSNALF
jgi:ubiquitin C-terminal hydrolase